MSTIVTDTLQGKTSATSITLPTTTNIGATPLVSASANSMTIRGEGSAVTNIQRGLTKGFICVDVSAGAAFSSNDSFNIGSVTDNGTGNFGLAFTNNMATVRYNSPGGCYTATGHTVGVTAEATTGTQMRQSDQGGSATDVDSYMAFIGNRA